jgi:hypothetical protein
VQAFNFLRIALQTRFPDFRPGSQG